MQGSGGGAVIAPLCAPPIGRDPCIHAGSGCGAGAVFWARERALLAFFFHNCRGHPEGADRGRFARTGLSRRQGAERCHGGRAVLRMIRALFADYQKKREEVKTAEPVGAPSA